jgi:uncharacterized membrane protein YphA (DoxX/SURF4 family)
MRHIPTVVRILVGLLFVVTGLNGFLHFLPMPPMAGPAATVMGGFAAARYLFPLIFGTQIVGGALLLAGRFVPLGLTLLAPVIVNIFLFHLALTPPAPIAFFLLIAEIYLAWSYRAAFRPMLDMNAKPTVAS